MAVKKTKREILNRIKEVAGEKGVTQAALAKKMDVEIMTVSGWYGNRKQPHLSDLKRVAKILDVDIRELLIATK